MGSVVFNGQSLRPGKVVCVGKNYAAHIEEMASLFRSLTLFIADVSFSIILLSL